MAKIKLTTPDGSKMEFDLTIDRATIGRADGNDIMVPDGSVSSRHGEILLKGDSIEVVDLGSTNGTHVGGQRVERATIAPGGTFKLGNVEGVLVAGPAAPPVSSAPAVEEPAEAAHEAEAASSWSGTPSAAAVISGLGATPCPVRQRKGFGSKVRAKDKVASLLSVIGVISLLACAGAAFLIYQMGA